MKVRPFVVALGALLLVVLAAPPAAPRVDTTRVAPAGQPTASIVERSPWADVGSPLEFMLDLAGPVPVERIEVRVHGTLDSADELAESHAENVGPVLYRNTFEVVDLEDAGGGLRRLRLDVSDTVNEGTTVRMAFAGVYPVVITPLASEGEEADAGAVVAGPALRTPVVRRSGAGTTLPAPELYLGVDLTTAATLEPEPDGWGWALDADQLDRIDRLADLVEAAPATALISGSTAAGLSAAPGGASARITEAVDDMVALPTVPLDWSATSRARLGPLRARLIGEGRGMVSTSFDAPDRRLWDGRGGLDDVDLDDIAGAGYDRVLVSSTDVRTTEDVDGRDAGGALPMVLDVDGPDDLDVVAVDVEVSNLLTRSAPGSDAAHVTLAELVLLAVEGAIPVGVVVDDLPEDSALAAVLPLLAHPDSPVPLRPLSAPLEDSDDRDVDPVGAELLPPDGGDVGELRARADRIRAADTAVDTYVQLVAADDPRAGGARALVAAATQRGLRPAERDRLLDAVDELTTAAFEVVRFSGPVDHNLTSRNGALAIGVVNDGDSPVNVVLTARSDRLRFRGGDLLPAIEAEYAALIEVPPGESRVDLPVEALATGSVPLYIELLSPDGELTFATRQLNVRSTAISGTGLVLSLGAIAVLLVWWIRTIRARRRAP